MKKGKLVAVVIVIAVVALALGATIGYSISSGRATTYTVTGCVSGHCALVITNEGNSSSNSSLSQCTVHAYGVIGLTIKNSSSAKPLSGLQVQVSETSLCGRYNLGSAITDANGTIMMQGLGSFSFGVKYDGSQYNVTGQAGPMSLTCITLYLPSGRVVNSSSSMSSASPNYC